MPINNLFKSLSTEDIFSIGSLAFFIILQLCPVYNIIPTIHSVFLNFAPFNNRFLPSKGNSLFFPFKCIFAFPFSIYKEGFGMSHWIIPSILKLSITSEFIS